MWRDDLKNKNPVTSGQRYGRLVTLHREKSGRPKTPWVCQCDCGKIKTVTAGNLKSGKTQSCGCLKSEKLTKHNLSRSLTYRAWANMLDRCKNPNNSHWNRYGGRGISVCDQWKSFDCFLKDMGEKPDRMSLDRIDNNGNYDPSNCRWATKKEQVNNTSKNHLLSFNGRSQTIAQWSDEIGINYMTLTWRISNGWSIERALTEVVNSVKKRESSDNS